MPPDDESIDDILGEWIAEGLVQTVYDPIRRELIVFGPDDDPSELHPETMN